ncbi:MAG: DMT family transporter [Sphingomonas sp.]
MTDDAGRAQSGLAGLFPLLAACACVAGPTVATKAMLDSAPALPVLLLQIVASTIVVTGIGWRMRRLPKLADWRLGLPGLVQPGLAYLLFYLGLQLVPASVEGLLVALEAGIVALLAWPLLGERPTWRVILAAIIGMAGVAMLGGAVAPVAAVSAWGVGLIVLGVVFAALDTIGSRYLMASADPLVMTIAGHWFGLVFVAASTFATGPYPWAPLLSAGPLAAIALAGIVIHGGALFLFNSALHHLPAAFAAALFPLISVMTALGGVLVLGERLSIVQIIGGALVIGSALLVVWCIERRESTAFNLPD